jgi:hypothetical protein
MMLGGSHSIEQRLVPEEEAVHTRMQSITLGQPWSWGKVE